MVCVWLENLLGNKFSILSFIVNGEHYFNRGPNGLHGLSEVPHYLGKGFHGLLF